MGLLTLSLVLYLVKRTRQRLTKTFGNDEIEMGDSRNDNEKYQTQNLDTRWVDGLRGIASVGVVSSHICLSFWQQLITPTIGGTDGTPMLFQRPIFRLVIQGQAFVALFFILMGFVNSLKPLRQAQNSQFEEALLTLARSALTRSARLVLPAVTMTVVAWLACQLGLNEVARKSDAYWMQHNSREPSSSWSVAIIALKDAIAETWVAGENPYDQPQWALKWLLVGSFWIFCVLLITTTTRPLFRMTVLAVLYVYSWISADFILGTNVYFGIFLAQIHTTLAASDCPAILRRDSTTMTRLIPYFSALVGLWLMSYPSGYATDASWSRDLTLLAAKIGPAKADVARMWTSVGAQVLCISIYFSPSLQRVLSHRIPCYLGGVSFSMYLLHGPLMRSVLAALVFGPAAMRQEMVESDGVMRYPLPARWTMLLSLPVFAAILLACVHAWAVKVEPIFARATKAMERFATGDPASRPGSPLQLSIDNSKKRDDVQK